jgi:hypothetical protein
MDQRPRRRKHENFGVVSDSAFEIPSLYVIRILEPVLWIIERRQSQRREEWFVLESVLQLEIQSVYIVHNFFFLRPDLVQISE